MAIVRTGVRVRKASALSSPSTDDGFPAKKKSKIVRRAASAAVSDASDDSEPSDRGAEICQVGENICHVPYELFDVTDLRKILSLDTWNFCLTEEERESLCSFLPNLDEESYRRTLKELFAGENFHFGSPLTDLSHRLKGGLCHPQVVRHREGLKYLQRKEHYHHLRKYHNGMVNNFLEMQNLWKSYPDADIEERLQIWHSWKLKTLPAGRLTEKKWEASLQPGKPAVSSKGVLKVKAALKSRKDAEDSPKKSHAKQSLKAGKLAPKGVVKMPPKGLSRRHVNSEVAALETMPLIGAEPETMQVPSLEEAEGNTDALPGAALSLEEEENNMYALPVAALSLEEEENNMDAQHVAVLSLEEEENNMDAQHVAALSLEEEENSMDAQPVAALSLEEEENNMDALPVAAFSLEDDTPTTDKLVSKKRREKKGNSTATDKIESNKRREKNGDSTGPGRKRNRRNENNEPKVLKAKEELRTSPDGCPVEGKFPEERVFQEEIQVEVQQKQKEVLEDSKNDAEPKKKYRRQAKVKDKSQGDECQATLVVKSEQDVNGLDWQKEAKGSEDQDRIVNEELTKGKTPKKRGKKRDRGEENGPLTLSSSPNGESVHDNAAPVEMPRKPALPIVPPIALSFPFSVLHLLSAVRTALIAASEDQAAEASNPNGAEAVGVNASKERTFLTSQEAYSLQQNEEPSHCDGVLDIKESEEEKRFGLPPIPFMELVKRVQANPGDFRILETEEPLQGLVRGVLKVLSSKTVQPGIKGWKPFVAYDKVVRGWSWIGPLPPPSFTYDAKEVQISADAWVISQKTLYKMQEVFANWLKNAQESLQLLGQLALPPLPSMPVPLDEKERFRELRAQKSLITINPITEEMRAYFRREEAVRYSVPDRAFTYTSADGRKSVVAPLKRTGGKPNSKARDHFMLKHDRPTHVTILCLVRDAAARLPGSIGTRADVCALIRDSQYIVEDISDAQLNQVVSGALDRLHYERDPCVRYDGDRKLWVYLHTDRDEEDFEDDGTSSTKRWKRPKKESTESPDFFLGPDYGYPCRDDQDQCVIGLDFNSPNCFAGPGDLSSVYSTSVRPELIYNHQNGSLTSPHMLGAGFPGQVREDSLLPFIELPPSIQPPCVSMQQSHPMGWEVLGNRWDLEPHLPIS